LCRRARAEHAGCRDNTKSARRKGKRITFWLDCRCPERALILWHELCVMFGMNTARCFMRRENYQPRQSPVVSPFRQFDTNCLKCGSYDLRLMSQMNEKSGELAVVLVCNQCRLREIMPVR
jgi:hypothetical protein